METPKMWPMQDFLSLLPSHPWSHPLDKDETRTEPNLHQDLS